MSYSAEIQIYGTVSDPEGMWDLALSAEANLTEDWTTPLERERFEELVAEAAATGTAVKLVRGDTKDVVDEVRAACQGAGLSYVVKYGERGAEGFSGGYAWMPGMTSEAEFLLVGGEPAVKVTELRRAARLGLDAVHALADAIASSGRAGKIEIAPGFEETYREDYSGSPTSFAR
jgi:hypothetical protein